MDTSSLFTLVFGLVLAAGIGAFASGRRRRQNRDEAALEAAVSRNLHVPESLHPVIDPDICIGSLSCLSACPEGDILGFVDGAATLVRGSNCIGHGRCAEECPVGAIRLVFGSSERGVDLPEVDETFESSRTGVHIIGELGGMGLIKNAIRQGLEAADFLAAKLAGAGAAAQDTVDVVIVGAGPSGLACALGCRQAGLTFRVLDQSTFGGTMAQYPRHKVVMTETVDLPFYGRFGRPLISKEELLEAWEKACRKGEVTVEECVRVLGIDGADGQFTVQTDKAPVAARKVVLAVGRRGTPRKLGVPGEDLPKVTYRLIDAEQYEDCRVLVVGGGDAALEAAIQLAEGSNAEVTLSHRGEALGKCREANRIRFGELVAKERIRALPDSQMSRVDEDVAALLQGEREVTVGNDYVIVCIGGVLPVEFLNKAGVQFKRHFGTRPGQKPAEPGARAARGSAKEVADEKHKRLAWTLVALGLAILAVLLWVGFDYYQLDARERLKSLEHPSLKPAGSWGHGVGLVATAFMLSNFLYAIRKRWGRLKGTAPIRTWLTFHMFVGFMSPLVIAFHSAFQSRNLVATGTFASLLVVVLTGVVGRYIYGWVPAQGGVATEYGALMQQFEQLKARLAPLVEALANPQPAKVLFTEAARPPRGRSLVSFFLSLPLDVLHFRIALIRIRSAFPDAASYHEFSASLRRLTRLRDQVGFYRSLKGLLSAWRALHAVLASLLVLMISAHIAISIYLGYVWVFE